MAIAVRLRGLDNSSQGGSPLLASRKFTKTINDKTVHIKIKLGEMAQVIAFRLMSFVPVKHQSSASISPSVTVSPIKPFIL